MNIDVVSTAGQTIVRLSGRFDFSVRNQFMARVDEFIEKTPADEIRIDLGGVDYIDSSTLGMLLMVRDKARKIDKTVSLSNVRGQVRDALDTAQFRRLFSIT
jgi:anti-anti-sigma factor